MSQGSFVVLYFVIVLLFWSTNSVHGEKIVIHNFHKIAIYVHH